MDPSQIGFPGRPGAAGAGSRLLAVLAVTVGILLGTARSGAEPVAAPGRREAGTSVGPGCDDGVVKDDGTLETGYGWIPSVVDGRYVQQFHSSEFPSQRLEKVCVCWLQTHGDSEIDFEVGVYEDIGGRPAPEPLATFPATAREVPLGLVGRMYEVDVRGTALPEGRFYLGVKWNPSRDQFTFVCVDKSPGTSPVQGFFVDDRADGWTSVLKTRDPIFANHRAMIIRASADEAFVTEIPALDLRGLVGLIVLTALAGTTLLKR